jgi:hypothetical protein
VTGREAMRLADRTLVWAHAELERKRARFLALDERPEDTDQYALYRSAAARAGGLRRGLLNECDRILRRGLDAPAPAPEALDL